MACFEASLGGVGLRTALMLPQPPLMLLSSREPVGRLHVLRIVREADHGSAELAAELLAGLCEVFQRHVVPLDGKAVIPDPGNRVGEIVDRVVRRPARARTAATASGLISLSGP